MTLLGLATRPRRLGYIAVVIAFLASLVIAFLVLSGPPMGGISKDKATTLALKYASSGGDVKLVFIRAGRLSRFKGDTNTNGQDNQWVWAVAFSGRWSGSCAPPDVPGTNSCPPPALSELVVLDYFSGNLVLIKTPSPVQ